MTIIKIIKILKEVENLNQLWTPKWFQGFLVIAEKKLNIISSLKDLIMNLIGIITMGKLKINQSK